MKCILIDDEAPARNIVKTYLKDFPEIEIIAECDNGFDGFKLITEQKPDLVFLDVQMPKLNGFEMLEILPNRPIVIFTTAFDQYAIKAFECNAVDYLLKPFARDRFKTAIAKAKEMFENQESNSDNLTNLSESIANERDILDRVIVKSGTKVSIVPVNDIMYVHTEDDYVMIHTKSGKYLKQGTMKYYETHLPDAIFARIHRSYIVNISVIDKMERYEKESYIVHLKNGDKIKTSKTGAKVLKKALNM